MWKPFSRASGNKAHTSAILPLIVALVLMLWGLIAIKIQHMQRESALEAEREAQLLTGVIAEQVARAVHEIDNTLAFIAHDFVEPRPADRLQHLVESGGLRMDNVVLLTIVGADGRMVQTNRGPAEPLDLSDREHIRVHLDTRVDGLFVGKPVFGRASSKWSIQLTRALHDATGQLTGVVVGSLDPLYFEQFWNDVRLPSHMRLEVIGKDGFVRASSRGVLEALTQGLKRPELIAELLGGTSAPNRRGDGERGKPAFFRELFGLDLLVVGFLDSEAIAPLQGSAAASYIGLGSVMSFALLFLGASLYRSARDLAAKQAEADLTRQLLRDAIEAVPGGFALFDAGDKLVVFNSAYERMYALGEVIREGATFEELVRAAARRGRYAGVNEPELESFIADRMALHRRPTGPFEHQGEDGRWVRVDERRTASGGIVGIRWDITEMRERELALARQTALLSATIEHMSEGLSVIDADGAIIATNRRFGELFNLPQTLDVSGLRLTEILEIFGQYGHVLPEGTNGDAEQALSQSIETPGEAAECLTSDDKCIEIRSSRLPDGGIVTTYADVSESRRIGRRIKQSEALKSAMISSSIDAVIIADEHGRIVEFNRAAEETFGWPAADVLGRRLSDTIVPEALRKGHELGMARFCASKQSTIIGQRLELTALHREATRSRSS